MILARTLKPRWLFPGVARHHDSQGCARMSASNQQVWYNLSGGGVAGESRTRVPPAEAALFKAIVRVNEAFLVMLLPEVPDQIPAEC